MPITRQQRALMRAVSIKDVQQVRSLLSKGVDPDFEGDTGLTPLETAIDTGSLAMVKALVENGADIDRENSDTFDTPLDRAKEQKEYRISSYLKSMGAQSFFDRSSFASRRYGAWADDNYDDDDAEDSKPAKKSRARKTAAPKAPVKDAGPPKLVFTEENLKDIFNGKAWAGKPEEMQKLWHDVPEKLKKKFDFDAALAEAKRETLKKHAPRLSIRPPQTPPENPPNP